MERESHISIEGYQALEVYRRNHPNFYWTLASSVPLRIIRDAPPSMPRDADISLRLTPSKQMGACACAMPSLHDGDK